MPKRSFSRRQKPADKPAAPAPPPAAKTPEPGVTPSSAPTPSTPARRSVDADTSGRTLQAQLEEAGTTQARLRLDLAELLKAHRQQGRVLGRNQKGVEQTEQELGRHRGRVAALEAEVAEQRNLAEQHASRVKELEQVVAKHATLQTAYETLDRERQDLTTRISDVTRSRATADADRDRLAGELAGAHATIAARDAEVAALKVEQEAVEARVAGLRTEIDALKRTSDGLRGDLERALENQAAHHRIQLEFEALSERWDVARAQLAQAEQAVKVSQATIKAAQRLSSSVNGAASSTACSMPLPSWCGSSAGRSRSSIISRKSSRSRRRATARSQSVRCHASKWAKASPVGRSPIANRYSSATAGPTRVSKPLTRSINRDPSSRYHCSPTKRGWGY